MPTEPKIELSRKRIASNTESSAKSIQVPNDSPPLHSTSKTRQEVVNYNNFMPVASKNCQEADGEPGL
jgi:hypothetical protein